MPEDNWTGHAGPSHEVLFRHYPADHPAPRDVDNYLCGPPATVRAAVEMRAEPNVAPERVAFDVV